MPMSVPVATGRIKQLRLSHDAATCSAKLPFKRLRSTCFMPVNLPLHVCAPLHCTRSCKSGPTDWASAAPLVGRVSIDRYHSHTSEVFHKHHCQRRRLEARVGPQRFATPKGGRRDPHSSVRFPPTGSHRHCLL